MTRRCGCLSRVMHMTCDPPNHPKPSQTPQKRHQCDARKSMGASVDSGACDTTQLHSSVAQWPIRICDECDLVMRGVPYKHHPPCPNRCKPCQGKHFCVKSLQSSGVPNMHVPSIHWLRQLIWFVIWHNLLVFFRWTQKAMWLIMLQVRVSRKGTSHTSSKLVAKIRFQIRSHHPQTEKNDGNYISW